MPVSPLQDSNGIVSLGIFSAGTDVSSTLQIISVEISTGLNKIPSAHIVAIDGNMPEGKFPLSDQDVFKPGTEIEIKIGYESKIDSVFKGIVVRHGLVIRDNGTSEIRIECKDKAVAMTLGRKNANFLEMDDSAIIQKMVTANGLSAEATCSAGTHKELIQYYCTDWDFMLTRAEANHCWVRIADAKVIVEEAVAKGSASLVLTYGTDIMAFSADADAQSQVSTVETVSWDSTTQEILTAEEGSTTLANPGNLDADTMEKVLAVPKEVLLSSASLPKEALKAWAKAQQIKNSLSRMRGKATFIGSSLAKIGEIIELKGVGERFSGTVLITSVKHDVRDGVWKTEVGFGMNAQWFSERHQTSAPMASGLTCGVSGLQIGVVTKLDGDPESKYRIQVKMPVSRNETEGIWARLGSPYASEQFGIFFVPEIGDEVILGFFNDDPSHPVILGSLYSGKRKCGGEITAENKLKSIVTRSKLTIEFEEEKKILTLKTPGNNIVTLDDDGKSITLKDQNGNKLVLDNSGILLDSPKDITIKAKGKITLDATGNLACSSKGDSSVEGMNVNLTAKASLTAKGSATAEFSASGQTVVKGAMVMIN